MPNTLAQLQAINSKVTTRTISILDMVQRSWGAEFLAPDHAAYTFGWGRQFDSTDRGLTGLYGVEVSPPLEAENPYPDMDATLETSQGDDLLYKD